MGVRIAFYEATDGKSLLDNLTRTFAEFRAWVLNENQQSIDEYKERLISEKMQIFLESNDVLCIENISQSLLDELTSEYLLTFCDHGDGASDFELIGPLIYRKRYVTSFIEIEKQQDKRLSIYWDYLKVGRSLREDHPFTAMDYNLIGFWSPVEIKYIKQKLVNMSKDDVGIHAVSNVLNEIGQNSELIFNLEI